MSLCVDDGVNCTLLDVVKVTCPLQPLLFSHPYSKERAGFKDFRVKLQNQESTSLSFQFELPQ